jgi:hypothetical protein
MSTGDLYLIWSHQHRGWWRPAAWGYTGSLFEAGRFTQAAADKELGWAEHREWLEDGRPHEVVITAPSLAEMTDVNVLLTVRDRVEQATTDAIAKRAAAGAR